MMTQEEYMDVLAMRRQGMSYVEIGNRLGYHPDTISAWVRNGGPPQARTVAETARVIDGVWADRLTALLVGNPQLLAKSLFEIITAEGFCGSYPSVVRWVRDQRGPRFRAADGASVPIETPQGRKPSSIWSAAGIVTRLVAPENEEKLLWVLERSTRQSFVLMRYGWWWSIPNQSGK